MTRSKEERARDHVLQAIDYYLAETSDDSDNRMTTDFMITAAFINLSAPADPPSTGYVHICKGASHSLQGLNILESAWLHEQ